MFSTEGQRSEPENLTNKSQAFYEMERQQTENYFHFLVLKGLMEIPKVPFYIFYILLTMHHALILGK